MKPKYPNSRGCPSVSDNGVNVKPMHELCAANLTGIVQGELQMSNMPPLGGAWEPIFAIRLNAAHVRPGDVLLAGPGLDERTVGRRQHAEEAFARQALGVITSDRRAEPWAGTFIIRVPHATAALLELGTMESAPTRGPPRGIVGQCARRAAGTVL